MRCMHKDASVFCIICLCLHTCMEKTNKREIRMLYCHKLVVFVGVLINNEHCGLKILLAVGCYCSNRRLLSRKKKSIKNTGLHLV